MEQDKASDEIGKEVKKSKCENCEANKIPILVPGNRTCFKLWICDVRLMLPSPIQQRAYVFRHRTVERVIVFGTVTDVKEFKTSVLYEVDDGTGNINCLYNHNYRLKKTTKNVMNQYKDHFKAEYEDGTYNLAVVSDEKEGVAENEEESSAIKSSFNWMLKEIHRFKRKMKNVFDLGDTICVKGRVIEFFGQRQIQVYQLHSIDNLKDESNHILEMVNLYKREYINYL